MSKIGDCKERILHILGIYPILSPSMLQIGVGTSLAPRDWRPALNKLIDEGEVVRDEVQAETPIGQHRTYVLLSLKK